jgi:uncharacterized protein
MKYLVVVLVVGVVLWLLMRGRKPEASARQSTARDGSPQAMVQCATCGVHLPRVDALLDQRGAYCSEAHQLSGPQRH